METSFTNLKANDAQNMRRTISRSASSSSKGNRWLIWMNKTHSSTKMDTNAKDHRELPHHAVTKLSTSGSEGEWIDCEKAYFLLTGRKSGESQGLSATVKLGGKSSASLFIMAVRYSLENNYTSQSSSDLVNSSSINIRRKSPQLLNALLAIYHSSKKKATAKIKRGHGTSSNMPSNSNDNSEDIRIDTEEENDINAHNASESTNISLTGVPFEFDRKLAFRLLYSQNASSVELDTSDGQAYGRLETILGLIRNFSVVHSNDNHFFPEERDLLQVPSPNWESVKVEHSEKTTKSTLYIPYLLASLKLLQECFLVTADVREWIMDVSNLFAFSDLNQKGSRGYKNAILEMRENFKQFDNFRQTILSKFRGRGEQLGHLDEVSTRLFHGNLPTHIGQRLAPGIKMLTWLMSVADAALDKLNYLATQSSSPSYLKEKGLDNLTSIVTGCCGIFCDLLVVCKPWHFGMFYEDSDDDSLELWFYKTRHWILGKLAFKSGKILGCITKIGDVLKASSGEQVEPFVNEINEYSIKLLESSIRLYCFCHEFCCGTLAFDANCADGLFSEADSSELILVALNRASTKMAKFNALVLNSSSYFNYLAKLIEKSPIDTETSIIFNVLQHLATHLVCLLKNDVFETYEINDNFYFVSQDKVILYLILQAKNKIANLLSIPDEIEDISGLKQEIMEFPVGKSTSSDDEMVDSEDQYSASLLNEEKISMLELSLSYITRTISVLRSTGSSLGISVLFTETAVPFIGWTCDNYMRQPNQYNSFSVFNRKFGNITHNNVSTKRQAVLRINHVCESCGISEPQFSTYLLCAGCRNVRYCSKKCQLQDWRWHRMGCVFFRPEKGKRSRGTQTGVDAFCQTGGESGRGNCLSLEVDFEELQAIEKTDSSDVQNAESTLEGKRYRSVVGETDHSELGPSRPKLQKLEGKTDNRHPGSGSSSSASKSIGCQTVFVSMPLAKESFELGRGMCSEKSTQTSFRDDLSQASKSQNSSLSDVSMLED